MTGTEGLLLIHAFPLDHRMWAPQLEALDGAVTVVAPDLPGFGGSPGAGEAMTMASGAARCLEALDGAGIDRAVVCGLSMGGYVAFELWRTAPERIAGLILANTRAEADAPEGAQGRRDLAARLREKGSGFLVETPPPLLSEDAPADLQDRVRELIAAQPAEAIAAASLGMAERPSSSEADLGGITVPTLVVASDGDRLIPQEVTASMAPRIPGARLLTIPGAGHLSNLEAPDAFTDGIREFLGDAGIRGG